MAESRLIGAYLAELSAQLPTPIVAELADGLDQTHRHYLGQGLGPDSAAAAAGPSSASRRSSWPRSPTPIQPAGPPAGCWRPGLWSAPAGIPR